MGFRSKLTTDEQDALLKDKRLYNKVVRLLRKRGQIPAMMFVIKKCGVGATDAIPLINRIYAKVDKGFADSR